MEVLIECSNYVCSFSPLTESFHVVEQNVSICCLDIFAIYLVEPPKRFGRHCGKISETDNINEIEIN